MSGSDEVTRDRCKRLQAQIAAGRDSATVRFGLGQLYLSERDFHSAKIHLAKALEFDQDYSAAWILLGKACLGTNDMQHASFAYKSGIEAAERNGNLQAARQVRVLQKRLEKLII